MMYNSISNSECYIRYTIWKWDTYYTMNENQMLSIIPKEWLAEVVGDEHRQSDKGTARKASQMSTVSSCVIMYY